MSAKISYSEMSIMAYIWKNGESKATDIAAEVSAMEGVDKNTAYTYIHRLVQKGFLQRRNPGFYCNAAVSRAEIVRRHFRKSVNRIYNGSAASMINELIACGEISDGDLSEIAEMIKAKNI